MPKEAKTLGRSLEELRKGSDQVLGFLAASRGLFPPLPVPQLTCPLHCPDSAAFLLVSPTSIDQAVLVLVLQSPGAHICVLSSKNSEIWDC